MQSTLLPVRSQEMSFFLCRRRPFLEISQKASELWFLQGTGIRCRSSGGGQLGGSQGTERVRLTEGGLGSGSRTRLFSDRPVGVKQTGGIALARFSCAVFPNSAGRFLKEVPRSPAFLEGSQKLWTRAVALPPQKPRRLAAVSGYSSAADASEFSEPPDGRPVQDLETISADAAVLNKIQLLGVIRGNFDVRYHENGRMTGRCYLVMKREGDKEDWIYLEAYDELARSIRALPKDVPLSIVGRLRTEFQKSEKKDDPTPPRKIFKILVDEAKLVEGVPAEYLPNPEVEAALAVPPQPSRGSSAPPPSLPARVSGSAPSPSPSAPRPAAAPTAAAPPPPTSPPGATTAGKFARLTEEDTRKLWDMFYADPFLFWDNRFNKRNPKAPDFKHKETGQGLWINSWTTPKNIHTYLEAFDRELAESKNNGQS